MGPIRLSSLESRILDLLAAHPEGLSAPELRPLLQTRFLFFPRTVSTFALYSALFRLRRLGFLERVFTGDGSIWKERHS